MSRVKASSQERRIVWLYMAFVFFSNFSAILYFLVVYLEHAGLGIGQVSFLLMTYQASKFVLEIPTGYIADRLGRKAGGVIGLVLLVSYYVVLLILPSYPLLVAAFFLKGLALALISGSFESLYIDAVDPASLVRYNTIERFVFYGSYAFAAMVGGLFASAEAFGASLGADTVAALCALACGLAFRGDSNAGNEQNDCRHMFNGNGAFAKAAESVVSTFCNILRDPIVLALFLMDAAQAFSFVGIEDFFTLVLQRAGMSSSLAGLCIAAQLVISAAVGLLVPRILELASERRLLVICAISRLVITAFILMPGSEPLIMAALYSAQLVLYALFAPVKYGLFQRRIEQENRCTAISIQSQMVSIGGLLFYLASGVLSARVEIEFVLLGALLITAVIYIPALLYSSRAVVSAG